MKRLQDQNLYEILEVAPDAPADEIAQAYARAKALFGPGSLATYTLMPPEEADALTHRIEEAGKLLLDPAARARYDAQLAAGATPELPAAAAPLPPVIPALAADDAVEDDDGDEEEGSAAEPPAPVAAPPVPAAPVPAPAAVVAPVPVPVPAAPVAEAAPPAPAAAPEPLAAPPPVVLPARTPPPIPLAAQAPIASAAVLLAAAAEAGGPVAPVSPLSPLAPAAPAEPGQPTRTPIPLRAVVAPPPLTHEPSRELAVAVPEGTAWTGEVLRKIREARGITVQQLSERTKVTRHHIENIEDDRYGLLPAPVYLRGILMSLSRELRLDGQKVARSYLERAGNAVGTDGGVPVPRSR